MRMKSRAIKINQIVPANVPINIAYMPTVGTQKMNPGMARMRPVYAVHLLKNLVFSMSKSLIVLEMAIRNWENIQAEPLNRA